MKAPFGTRWTNIGYGGLAAGLAALALGIQFASAGQPADVVGQAEVVSGDALHIEDVYVRLHGIDAPAFAQTCRDNEGARHEVGRRAAERLQELVAEREVSCRLQPGHAGQGVLVGACSVEGRDLSTALIDDGLGWPASSAGDHASAAAAARARGQGIWSLNCRTPQAWRADPGVFMGLRPTTD